jgi:hypothetical protein
VRPQRNAGQIYKNAKSKCATSIHHPSGYYFVFPESVDVLAAPETQPDPLCWPSVHWKGEEMNAVLSRETGLAAQCKLLVGYLKNFFLHLF